MPYPQNSAVTTDDGGGGTTAVAPAPRYPRNRVASWRPTAHQQPPGGYTKPVTDGPSSNPWTTPNVPWKAPNSSNDFAMDSAASGDPAAGMKPGSNPGNWGNGSWQPGNGAGWKASPVTPNGQPGPTKYNVKYGPWGNKIQESYDGGNMPQGKDGTPYMLSQVMPQGPRPEYSDKAFQDAIRNQYLGGNQFAQFDGAYNGGMPYSIAGGNRITPGFEPRPQYPGQSKIRNAIDTTMVDRRYQPMDNYPGFDAQYDNFNLSPWDSPMQAGDQMYYGSGNSGGGK